ncbi:uncharacterized protein LOC119997538 [Tripterygium wilfordii]|uniref:uncharacterized protein LOC119997538 n=1 Tax=Tripterygium wilfordii TaxID=458696 RepID=UPI0018F863FA|nr:uncharacterized protein LOC119997538 [Tripterygium wilfordii]
MATGAASDGLLRYFYEGCISSGDTGIQRRPYHRNCGCALHNKGKNCPHGLNKGKNVSYPIRRSWSEGSLVLAAANSSCHSSPSSSPAAVAGPAAETGNRRYQLGSCNDLGSLIEEDEDIVFFKV